MALDVATYLQRLGVTHGATPSVEGLFALHRAHVSAVPYETLEIQLGRSTTIDPEDSATRIVGGRGGYCYHLNGAFSALLLALGYAVTRHVGGVYRTPDTAPGPNANHLALTVDVDGDAWLADVGLGNALYEPIQLQAGRVTQGPFRYELEPSPLAPGGWRFHHDPALKSFGGMDFAAEPATMAHFAARHVELSTSPQSMFVRFTMVQRRTASAVDSIKGCMLWHDDATGRTEHVLASAADWFSAVADVFGMPLADISASERRRLWHKLCRDHEEWLASQA